MKTSLVLFHQDALEKFPYLHYIYNAIIDTYSAKGVFKKVSFQEASFQKIATDAGNIALFLVEIPIGGSLKKGLWEKINYPALVKQLRPENIFYLGEHLPILKDAKGAKQWSFVPDIRRVMPSGESKAAVIKKKQKLSEALLLADRIVSYSPVAIESIKTHLPAAASRLVSWLPVPASQYLSPSLYTDALTDAFKEANTNGDAYFLIGARASVELEVIEFLKAFSHFKKWQRSSMQLGLLIAPSLHQNEGFIEKFDAYLYRKDVHLLSALDTKTLYSWIHAAYAVVSPYTADQGLDIQLATASLETLIVAPETSTSAALLPKARYDLAATDKESLGQVLISSYKSEILRSRHIRAGLEAAQKWKAYEAPDLHI